LFSSNRLRMPVPVSRSWRVHSTGLSTSPQMWKLFEEATTQCCRMHGVPRLHCRNPAGHPAARWGGYYAYACTSPRCCHSGSLLARFSNLYLTPRRRFTSLPGRHAMPATSMHRCRSCEEWFTPDRYNAWHQHYCSKPSCRAASHFASSADWRRKNPGYFRGEAHCIRVRSWRADHPGYWRRQRRRPAPAATPALQDVADSAGVSPRTHGARPERRGAALWPEDPPPDPSQGEGRDEPGGRRSSAATAVRKYGTRRLQDRL
jgi:hypothetical protein